PTSLPTAHPRSSAMRRAMARAATRRGCSRMSAPSSASAGGTRVVFPAPGGAVTTRARCLRTSATISARRSSIGSGCTASDILYRPTYESSMSTFLEHLPGAIVMAPMTKGSNLPYRRLAIELGARVLVSEMVVARRLRQRRRGELALVRRAPGEPCFGVQLAGNRPDEVAFAAAMAEARGGEFVDLNLRCPIGHFTR